MPVLALRSQVLSTDTGAFLEQALHEHQVADWNRSVVVQWLQYLADVCNLSYSQCPQKLYRCHLARQCADRFAPLLVGFLASVLILFAPLLELVMAPEAADECLEASPCAL